MSGRCVRKLARLPILEYISMYVSIMYCLRSTARRSDRPLEVSAKKTREEDCS